MFDAFSLRSPAGPQLGLIGFVLHATSPPSHLLTFASTGVYHLFHRGTIGFVLHSSGPRRVPRAPRRELPGLISRMRFALQRQMGSRNHSNWPSGIRHGLSHVSAAGYRRVTQPAGGMELPNDRPPSAHSAFGEGSGFLRWYFSLRMDSFQVALICSSEAVNGLFVPRDLRYSSFVMFDFPCLSTGGAAFFESRLLPS